MSDDEKDNDKAGYGKPPKKNRFVKGTSGNPKGRPKGARNLSTEIDTEMRARVPLTVNGKRKKVSNRRIVAKQLVGKGARGDAKSIALLMNHDRQRDNMAPEEPALQEVTEAEDLKVIKTIIKRILAAQGIAPVLPEDGEYNT